MLQAGSERPLPAGRLWVPGMSPQAAPSARALEIARRRDEMLGMLHGLPESEYELSLTDLVEKTNGNAGVAHPLPLPPPPSEGKKAGQPSPQGRPAAAGLSESGRQAEQQPALRGSARRRGDSGSGSGSGSGRSSFRSSSDSVLLNFYMPRSFTRSFTSPRASHHGAPAPGGNAARAASAVIVPDDSNKRERDSDAVKCWPMPWDRRWRKSTRRDQAGESAAMLGSSAAEEKV